MYMAQQKSKNLKIINKNGKILLEYLYKINKKTVKRKNKAGTINKFYLGYMPPEVMDYFGFKENTIFFYEKNGQTRISSVMPTVENQSIKVQQNNTYSLPRGFLDPSEYEFVKLTVDFNTPDDYMNGGTLTIELL